MDNPPTLLPRVTIQFCTKCRWMLRAAYFAQELLSTFSTSLGEVALQPSTGGIFIIHLYSALPPSTEDEPATIQEHLLWDRKAEGRFPETKELKRRVRDIIDPARDLGHVDGRKNSVDESANESIAAPHSYTPPIPTEGMIAGPLIPRAINRLQAYEAGHEAERKFTPMDVDVNSRRTSSVREVEGQARLEGVDEEVNERGKIRIGGEEVGFCPPGEDCA